MTDPFTEYFINPIIDKTGYNPVNTIAYGILLILASYGLFKFLKKVGIKVDYKFFKYGLPFVLFVGVWRSLTDAGVYPYHFLTTTPGLYIPVLAIFFPLIILSKQVEKKYKIPYWKIFTGVSIGLLVSQLIFIRVVQFEALFLIIYFSAVSSLPFILLYAAGKLKNKLNLLMFLTHMFDATVTHVSISYFGYFEQHVVPNLFINLFGSTLAFYLLKLMILIPVIFVLNKYGEDKELNDWIRIVFIIYGLAIGTRGLLRVIMGV